MKMAPRIKGVRRRTLLTTAQADAAERINDARNEFLHGRRLPPTYAGAPITEDQGLYKCLDDALKVWLAYARAVNRSDWPLQTGGTSIG